MKKAISILLCMLMLALATVPYCAAESDKCTCENIPIIYVKGRTNIYKDKDDPDSDIAETNFSGNAGEAAINIFAALGGALLTDNYDRYCDVMYEELLPIYDGYGLNDDGEVDNNSGITPYWHLDSILDRVYAGGREDHKKNKWIGHYEFQYDCRLDPCVVAADLHTMVEAVKEVTGHDKVIILARCFGTVIANAYLNIYGADDLESIMLYNPISDGAEIADAMFSANLHVEPEALNRFVYEFFDPTPVYDLVKAVVELAAFNKTLGVATDFINGIVDKVSSNLIVRLVRDIFGKCPGWYGMISTERYEECKATMLGDNEGGRYDKLIEKIDNYNYNYKTNARGILEQIQNDPENPTNVYIIVKYNDQMYPVVEEQDKMGDGVVSVWNQTFKGAHTADYKQVLSADYLAGADSKYISPDNIIDASGALFPEQTWFVRDLPHDVYPRFFDLCQINTILRYNGRANVNTFEDIPQWLIYEGTKDYGGFVPDENNYIIPLTSDNYVEKEKEETPKTDRLGMLFDFLKKVFTFLLSIFKK